MTTREQYVYYFGDGHAEGNAKMKNVLGGKGAGLAEMTNIGVPVPPGFTISTGVCTYFYDHDKTYPPELHETVAQNLARVEASVGRTFGDPSKPLLVSVRSGARASMPGMMDTILNLGLNDETVKGLAVSSGDERFALDSYRRFIQMYQRRRAGDRSRAFRARDPFTPRAHRRRQTTRRFPPSRCASSWRRTRRSCATSAAATSLRTSHEQLWGAIGAVFNSWNNQRAITYRKLNRHPGRLGHRRQRAVDGLREHGR